MPKLIDVGVEANGVIAIGAIATGVIAIGQLATGVIAIGQLARGVVAIGQGALGIRALGQLSVGVWRGSGMLGVAGFRTKGILVPLDLGPGTSTRRAGVADDRSAASLLPAWRSGGCSAPGSPSCAASTPPTIPACPSPPM